MLKNRQQKTLEDYNRAEWDLLMVTLRNRYNSHQGQLIAHSRVFHWDLETYLSGRTPASYRGHASLLRDGNDLAHAVLARDEWGIIWC